MTLVTTALAVAVGLQEAGAALLALPEQPPPATPEELGARLRELDGLVRCRLDPVLAGLAPGAPLAEAPDAVPGEGTKWLVDPIDGAVQLVQGLPQWCLSATLVRDGTAVLTALHHPLAGATYVAALGEGARRNGRSIAPSRKRVLAMTLVGTSHPPHQAEEPAVVAATGRALASVLMVAGAVRNLGPTSWQVADVASGRLDAFWELGRDDANLLGAALVAAEAGATVTDADGAPWRVGATSFLAAPPQLHGGLLAALRGGPATSS